MIQKIGKILLFSVVILLSFFIGARLGGFVLDWQKTVPVGNVIPDNFPVLVIESRAQDVVAHVVYHKDLNGLLRQNVNYSFLIPANKEQEIKQLLKENSRGLKEPPDFNSQSPDPWFATFKVKQLSADRQYIRFESTWDDDRVNVGWYEATDKEIFPKKYRFYFAGSVAAIYAFFFIILTTVISVFILQKIINRKSTSDVIQDAERKKANKRLILISFLVAIILIIAAFAVPTLYSTTWKSDAKIFQEIHKGNFNNIHFLETLSVEAAEKIAAEAQGEISFMDLTTLSPEAARALSKYNGPINLAFVPNLSDETIEALSMHKNGLYLNGLTTLSDRAAVSLCKHDRLLYMTGLKFVSDKGTEILGRCDAKIILSDDPAARDIRSRIDKFKVQ